MKKAVLLALAAGAWVMTGCSDKSSMRFSITNVSGNHGSYIDSDVAGNANDPDITLQDVATVTASLEKPGTVGPGIGGTINNVVVDYYYYDPNDGALKGPVSLLSAKQYNFSISLSSNGSATFSVPVGTFVVKSWTYGYSDCFGVPGFRNGIVDRVIARITVNATDDTGKKLSAQGSIMMYIYDWGPYPRIGDTSYGLPTATRVAGLCP